MTVTKRAVRRCASVAAVLATLASIAVPVASAHPARIQQVPVIPPGFKLKATNGWTAEVLGAANPKTGASGMFLTLTRGREQVIYSTRDAEVTETSMTASFGALGEVEVHSVPIDGATFQRSACGNSTVSFPSGRWEGTIDFHGEEGFTTIEAASARASIEFGLNLVCAEERDEGIGGHAPGAHLELRRRDGAETLELSVRKNRRVGPTTIRVDVSEHRGGLEIDRSVGVVAPSGAFEFEIPPGLATVDPPKPFTGSLALVRHPGSPPHVSGDLKVDLPGRAAVPIIAPGSLHASLIRAVLNPSHPF